jgi:mannose-6-phosphate isomerase-like protein (cupin superfamily)
MLFVDIEYHIHRNRRRTMAIAVARRSEGPKHITNGYGQVEWLAGVHPMVKGYKCILPAGHTITPERYEDKTVVYIFGSGRGYITCTEKAFNIDDICFFVPNFAHEEYQIYAAKDLEYMMVMVDMLDSDKAAYIHGHTLLPFFRRLSDAEEYTQSCKGHNTRSWYIIHPKTIARILMGVVKADGEGTTEKGHASVDQWNYALPGAEFTLTVESESIQQYQGDWSFVPAGLDHSLISEPGKSNFYVWFEHMTEELPIRD